MGSSRIRSLPGPSHSLRARDKGASWTRALALPQVVMARPEGVGHALTAYRMPIEGREEWIAAAGRLLA
jgi:hypothetical protein